MSIKTIRGDDNDEEILEDLKNMDMKNHKELLEQFKIHEEISELETFINNSKRFVQSFDENTNNPIITMIRKKIEEKQQELNEKQKKKKEDDLHSLFTPFIENELVSRYFIINP